MSKDALPEKACQLDSRYWRITNAKGDVDEVQGPGVVGKSKIAFTNPVESGFLFNVHVMEVTLLAVQRVVAVQFVSKSFCYLKERDMYLLIFVFCKGCLNVLIS